MGDRTTFSVGTIVGFLGLAGEVKVRPTANNPNLLLDIETVHAELIESEGTLDLTVDEARFSKGMLILSFAGYPDRTSVERLEGAKLYTTEDQIAPLADSEFWVSDLIGVTVYKTSGELVGSVCSIVPGANDLLEIRREGDPDGKTILVPFVEELVPLVDWSGKRIEVVDLPGLLEPQ